ncbi:MAG: Hpt domain-containing protein [Desulfobacterales bacterium]|nr:Hpt domain-containing protein [Desulfobacterales bacterium]
MDGASKDPPINLDELMDIMDGDQDLIQDCLGDFAQEYPAMLEAIGTAIEAGDDEELERQAHALKGSLRYLAAGPAAQAAESLEMMGRERKDSGRSKVFALLEVECIRLQQFIASYSG